MNKPKIALLQHVSFENPGSILDWIKMKQYESYIYKLYEGHPLPSVEDFDWLIIMGGPMGTKDIDTHQWLAAEKKLIRDAITHHKKVLGICLGSQLIAEALGSRVYPCSEKEIGWWPVKVTGTGNEIFQTNILNVFQWHGDTFDLPSGAEWISSSPICPHQAFIYHKKTIGLQYHLEIKEDIISSLLTEGKEELIPKPTIQTAETILSNAKHLEKYHEKMNALLEYLEKQ